MIQDENKHVSHEEIVEKRNGWFLNNEKLELREHEPILQCGFLYIGRDMVPYRLTGRFGWQWFNGARWLIMRVAESGRVICLEDK